MVRCYETWFSYLLKLIERQQYHVKFICWLPDLPSTLSFKQFFNSLSTMLLLFQNKFCCHSKIVITNTLSLKMTVLQEQPQGLCAWSQPCLYTIQERGGGVWHTEALTAARVAARMANAKHFSTSSMKRGHFSSIFLNLNRYQ